MISTPGKRLIAVSAVAWLLGSPAFGVAQEVKDTPSQKTKEAVEKFKKAPATVTESLEALKEAAKAQLEATVAPKKAQAKTKSEEPGIPKLAEPTGPPRYSSAGKRDPFRPFALKAREAAPRSRENLTPLERCSLDQLKLAGIIWDIAEPRALLEDNTGCSLDSASARGLGYTVKVGTAVGPNEGKIKAIKPGEIVIEETYSDVFGARKSREIIKKLPAD